MREDEQYFLEAGVVSKKSRVEVMQEFVARGRLLRKLSQKPRVLGVGTVESELVERLRAAGWVIEHPSAKVQVESGEVGRLAELVLVALAERAQLAARSLAESGDSLREQGSLVTSELEVAGRVLSEVPTRRYARRQDALRSSVGELVQFVKTGSASLVGAERGATVPLDGAARAAALGRYCAAVERAGSDEQQDAWAMVLGCWREADPSTAPGQPEAAP